MIEYLNTNSGAAQVILALVMVVTTIFYTVLTRRTVGVLEKQTEAGVRPMVAAHHFHVPEKSNFEHTYCVYSNLVNLGLGVAVNIGVEFRDYETAGPVGTSTDSLDYLKADGEIEGQHIHLAEEAFRGLKYAETPHGLAAEWNCIISFQDIQGRTFRTTQRVLFVKASRKIIAKPGTLRLL